MDGWMDGWVDWAPQHTGALAATQHDTDTPHCLDDLGPSMPSASTRRTGRHGNESVT